jgi:hypothetical protein
VTAVRFCDELDFALGWIHPEPAYQRRASHALAVDGRVWLFDPTEGDGVDERVRALGEPAGVIQQFGRHARDCRAFAERYGVPLHVLSIGDAPFEEIPLSATEIGVWSPAQRTLVVGEAVGTGVFDRTIGERLGVHPMMRLSPPKALLALSPEHLLVGHGAGLHGPDATTELHRAIRQSARRAPLLALNLVPGLRSSD